MRPFSLALMVAIMLGSSQTQACDICGCGGGSNSFGLLPMVQRNFVGFRWQLQEFDTRPHGSGFPSTENFRTLDLWARWQLHPRVQIIAVAPYLINDRHYQDGTQQHTSGFGDASFFVQAALLHPGSQSVRSWQHSLQLGLGLKVPTGKTSATDSEGELLAIQQQPGSGSTDALISAFYALRHKRWGLSIDATLKINRVNKNAYQLGNRLSDNLRFFVVKKAGKMTILPHVGLLSEFSNEDRLDGKWQGESGGSALFATLGIDVFRNNVVLGMNGQVPIASNLAKGYVTPKTRFNASATLLFGGKKKMIKMDVPQVFPNVQTKG